MIRITITEAAQKRGVANPKQLADKMGVAHAPVWKIWTGAGVPTLPTLDKVCDALNCNLLDLVSRTPNRRNGRK